MKKFSLIITILIMSLISFAENTNDDLKKDTQNGSQPTSFSGKIVDEITGEALAGVKVTLVENNEVVYTDFEGNFKFSTVSNGKYTVATDFISYKKSVHQNINTRVLRNLNIKLISQN